MSDEWKVPGTEPEENQQTVVEETETAEVTDGKENEEAAAEEIAETTESTEQDVTPEQAEVTETAEEVRPDADTQAGETGEVKTRYPWEAVLGKEERKEADQEQVEQSAPETPVQPQEQAAPQSDAQTTDPQAAGSYHWVNPEYQKRQNGTDGEERTSQNTEIREYTSCLSFLRKPSVPARALFLPEVLPLLTEPIRSIPVRSYLRSRSMSQKHTGKSRRLFQILRSSSGFRFPRPSYRLHG